MRNFKTMVLALMSSILLTLSGYAQVHNPVKWKFTTESLGNNEFNLIFTADIEHPWHMYGMENHGDDGPVPTSFKFLTKEGFELIGDFSEPAGVVVEEPMFGITLKYFEHKASFKQKIKLTAPEATIKGEVDWMVCDDSQCLPPDYVEFAFDLKGEAEKTTVPEAKKEPMAAVNDAPSMGSEPESGILKPVTWSFEIEDLGNGEYNVKAVADIKEHWHLYSMNLPSQDGPIATEFNILNESGVEKVGEAEEIGTIHKDYDKNFMMDLTFFENTATLVQKVKVTDASEIKVEVYFMACDDSRCITPEGVEHTFSLTEEASGVATHESDNEEEQSLWKIFFLSVLGGLGALITPCVFPMIPMTVSFFTKQSKTKAEGIKKGSLYGFFIVATYVALSIPFHLFSQVSPDIFNEFSTNPYLNLFFFAIFIVFAVSFLGAFEITMPNSWVNKADAKADKGGMIGIFFMALVLILVSFSCTGPALGLLLGSVLSTDGGATALSIGLFGFGLGLGFPFALFAIFPGWLNSLPQSGGWLNVVKVSFGFVELAFAFKFLSNADLVMQWHLVEREVFLAIWVGVFAVWGMYLFNVFKMPHDSIIEKISVGRAILGTFVFVFVIYLLPGMWGAPLKLIAGFPPPAFYSESPKGVGYKGSVSAVQMQSSSNEESADIPIGAEPDHCPHGLNCFHDYETGMNYAKEIGKPVILDFTGWACVNCRRMEENVWADPRVLERLRNDYVLISLYVDEKAKLPESEQYVSEVTGKKIRTVGNRWSEFQIKHYQSNTQPYYVVIDHDQNQLIEATGYDPDIDKYIDWLDRGKVEFEK